jgi:(3,5-dihydroxyphenyl)acetyl-CoA 1,2-dioxygenase
MPMLPSPTLEVLRASGLAEDQLSGWAAAASRADGPPGPGAFDADARETTSFLEQGERLLAGLPARPRRDEREQAAADAIIAALHEARERFLRAHAERLYTILTDDLARPLRVEELLERAAERFPGLTPSSATVAAERQLPQRDKDGAEIAQGLVLAHVLSSPRAGAHLVWAMLRPTDRALEHLEEFRATGRLDLGKVVVRRERRAGVLELRNPRHLNAEDDSTIPATELAVDLILLDPAIEVGVLRGGTVNHPRYAGRRIFGAGINLTHLYYGQISFLFYIVRDLGYVNKIYRGLSAPEHRPGEPEDTTEKLWIAAAETYAIGGACQLLHVMDHVIAERGCRLYLPARKEGIIPGASNLRLPRFVGDRLARQAILSGRELEAGTPEAGLICDEVVEPGEMDAAIERRIDLLTSSGLVNAAANRRTLRIGEEPLDVFRLYMATYALEQSRCHFSPALIRNLERNWDARNRRL